MKIIAFLLVAVIVIIVFLQSPIIDETMNLKQQQSIPYPQDDGKTALA